MAGTDPLTIHDIRETFFFSEDDLSGAAAKPNLKQWIEIDLSTAGWRTAIEITISSGDESQLTNAVVFGGRKRTIRCYAPALWPGKPDTNAALIIMAGGKRIRRTITIGTHRPWTIYLMSDLCADDTWAYSDLAKHDRDDYLTTLSELNLGEQNAYSFAATNQSDRFIAHATPKEMKSFAKAVNEKRLYITPIPDQLLCGIFNLSSYPTILDPYRRTMARVTGDTALSRYAYHMESPTWTNGFANMLAGCGCQVLGKSLLRYQAPWMAKLDELPRIVRLKTAPNRYVYLVLGRHGYDEGSPILSGVDETTRYLHEDVIPSHQHLGDSYPTSAVGLIGMYSDLRPDSPEWGAIKCQSVNDYNNQGWDYPKLVNSNWHHFGDHLTAELGPPDSPYKESIVTVVGDIGSSWEVWTLAAQHEYGKFRQAQRSVVSLSTLHAMKPVARYNTAIDEINEELAYLGDHAWNGSHKESKQLNLKIRRRRLKTIAEHCRAIRENYNGDAHPAFAATNTLGWNRLCEVPAKVSKSSVFRDVETGQIFDPKGRVPIPGFGYRNLEIVKMAGDTLPSAGSDAVNCLNMKLYPVLDVAGKTVPLLGSWHEDQGSWTLGPFAIDAQLIGGTGLADCILDVSVHGIPPEDPYDLRWVFELPWKRCTWRGESGGGFVTPGPIEDGGDSLLGIRGSIFSAGEGIAAANAAGKKDSRTHWRTHSHRIEFAFDQTGMCGLGGKTTATALGTYNEKMTKAQIQATTMKSTVTKGVLEWYLLSTGQNPYEALINQGGRKSWVYRCGIRTGKGGFDDAELFRFAAGFNTPAEICKIKQRSSPVGQLLSVTGDKAVIPLSLRRHGKETELNIYNAADHEGRITVAGALTDKKHLSTADMLGNQRAAVPGRNVHVPGKSFIKVVLHE